MTSDADAWPSSPAFSPGHSNGPRRGEYALISMIEDVPGGSDGRVSSYNAGDLGSIPGSGRSPGEGNGNPLQYSCLGNSMDRGAWQAPWGRKELTTEQLTQAW